ncbi:hypothetical protein ABZ934_19495 [Streptomyces sp. NPDC046557]|uniref:hypothetical protein n=1 Tax=Streptomyces sp. NPDC046557 TaxID=3155372 RepID=UPI0033D3C805
MKLSPNTTPAEPDNLLIRMHNQVAAAVDVIGTLAYHGSGWRCHGCGDRSEMLDNLLFTRRTANEHADTCRAAYHRLG